MPLQHSDFKGQKQAFQAASSDCAASLLFFLFYLQFFWCWFNLEVIYELETRREIKSRTCVSKLGNIFWSTLPSFCESSWKNTDIWEGIIMVSHIMTDSWTLRVHIHFYSCRTSTHSTPENQYARWAQHKPAYLCWGVSYFHKISHVSASNMLCSICSFLPQKHRFLHEPPLLIQTSINWIIISVSRQKLRVRHAFTASSHGFMPPHTIWIYPLLSLIHTHTKITSRTLGKETNLHRLKNGGKKVIEGETPPWQ